MCCGYGTINCGMHVLSVIIIKNFFQEIPESLAESASIDGAGEWLRGAGRHERNGVDCVRVHAATTERQGDPHDRFPRRPDSPG